MNQASYIINRQDKLCRKPFLTTIENDSSFLHKTFKRFSIYEEGALFERFEPPKHPKILPKPPLFLTLGTASTTF